MSPITFSEVRCRMRVWDILLVLLLLALSLLPLFGTPGGERGQWLRINAPGAVQRYRLDRERTVRIAGRDGALTLRIDARGARVLASDCPRHFCIRSGTIARRGERIVCVPLEVEIVVEGRLAGGDVICH